jgi:methylamine dehydrogenase heavy chain
MRRALLAPVLAVSALAAPVSAELPAERVGEVATLAAPQAHWIWVADFVLRRAALLDADDDRFLGQISTGVGSIAPITSPARGQTYLPETYFSRGSRGTRVDLVTIYDMRSLAPVAEVEIPPRRADVVHAVALATLLDEGRFLAVYNFSPATSVSIVDVETRRFVGEIATPGCGLVYAAGPRRFAMICGDGSLLLVSLDAQGRERARLRSERFFDPLADPVTEKAVRSGSTWHFVSFDGVVHPVDLAGENPVFGERWSLFTEAERAASWRIGGTQHLALHEATGRLYALVHQGGPHGHKDPGSEVRVFDLATRAAVGSIALRNLAAAFLGQQLDVRGGALGWILERTVPDVGTDSIAVTQDADPRLLALSLSAGTVGVYDARSGAFLRHLEGVGLFPGVLLAPWR